MKLKKTENIIVLGIFLGIIGALSAGIMAYFAELTRKPIAEMQMSRTNKALKELLPDFDNQPSQDTITVKSDDEHKYPVKFYVAKKGGKVVGLAGEAYTVKGYGGEVVAMAGLAPDGRIRTVIVTKQNETPGLGTVVTSRKYVTTIFNLLGIGKKIDTSKLPPNPILDQFDGHAADKSDSWTQPWKVRKDGGNVNFITGATVSSRAVTEVVFRIASTYMANKNEILNKFEGASTEKPSANSSRSNKQ